MQEMESIFTGRDQVDNLRKSFEKLGVNADEAIQELSDKNKYQLRAKSSCRQCWGTGNVQLEQELPPPESTIASTTDQYITQSIKPKKGLVDKLCHCVKVKKRK